MSVESYDVIIVGSGAGGLSVATSLAQGGKKVLVVEKNDRPGGCCTAKMYGDYKFDLAVHQLTGVGDKGQCGAILREYGVADKLNFKQVDPFLVLDLPDKQYHLPGTWDAFRAELIRLFPDSEKNINRFLDAIQAMKQDTIIIQRQLYGKSEVVSELMEKDVSFRKKLTFPFSAVKLLMDGSKTGAQLFGKYIKDKELLGVLAGSWPYMGLPPSKISGVLQAFLVAGQHYEQTYYPVGSSQTVADAFNDSIEEHNGTILLNTEVAEILVKNNNAYGVKLADGKEILAEVVISNVAAPVTYKKLIDPEKVPRHFMRKLDKMKPSLGPFKVLLGMDFDIAEHGLPNHEYMFYESLDHEEIYEKMSNCEPACISAYSPTKIDPSLAPEGHSTVIMTIMVNWDSKRDWRTEAEAISEDMIDRLEKRVPEVRKHIKEKVIFTPEDLKQATNAHNGSMYGWECNVDQVLIKRLAQKSPIKNLYNVGHWSEPGPGVTVAIISGWILGSKLLKKMG